ncbi:response regulator [Sulfurimonas sp. SAG-AH-194-C21]|nr:response regulator [Sulfurimonas sp. SAG-AH-194-C21]MDF1883502.1 response regulator [Sulfurimonas sp. SAG-AH-194-C21]
MHNINDMLEYTKPLNILYVEDTLDMQEYIQELLNPYFQKIDLAVDGSDALEKYIQYKDKTEKYYDLVITDINMPKLNGIDMSEDIIEINPTQKIIITTGYNGIDHLQRAIDIGVDSFITKPIRKNQFLNVLSKVSQNIMEHKFFLSHIQQIEELNLELNSMNQQLESQNLELSQKNDELKKSFRMLDTMVEKEQVCHAKDCKESVPLDDTTETYIQEQIEILINEDLYDLIDIHTSIDLDILHILDAPASITQDILLNLSDLFNKYSSILAYYNFFDDLSATMLNFSNVIKENPLPDNEDSIQNIFILVESFTYILGKWQTNLVSSDLSKINSLDASMMSDMSTIINMWTQKEIEATDEEMDDIFDF